ncbi:unnamed protein product, partial [Linum tenue]
GDYRRVFESLSPDAIVDDFSKTAVTLFSPAISLCRPERIPSPPPSSPVLCREPANPSFSYQSANSRSPFGCCWLCASLLARIPRRQRTAGTASLLQSSGSTVRLMGEEGKSRAS